MRVAAARSGVGRHKGCVTARVYPLLMACSRPGRPSMAARGTRGRLDVAPLKRLAALTRPHSRWLVLGVASVAVAGLIGLAFPLVVRTLLDAAFAPGAAPAEARRALDTAMLLLVALMLVQAGFNFLRTYSLGRVGEAVVADLRK